METLADRIAERGALPPDEAVRWVLRLVLALEPLHRRGGAHGAVGAGSVHIEAGPLGIDQLGDPRTATSLAMYHCPERARGGSISPSDDTWAVAVTLFHALTGAWPYEGENDDEVNHSISDSTGISLADHGVQDDALDELLSRALRPGRMDRVLMLPVVRERLEDWLIEQSDESFDLRPLDLEGAVVDSGPAEATSQLDSHEVGMPETRRLEDEGETSAADLEAAMKLRGEIEIDTMGDMPETRRVDLGDIPEPPRSRPPSMVITPRSERPPPVQESAPPTLENMPPTLALPDVPPPPELDEEDEDVPPTKVSLPPVEPAPPPSERRRRRGSSSPPKPEHEVEAATESKSKTREREAEPDPKPRSTRSSRPPPMPARGSRAGVWTYVGVGIVLGVVAGVAASVVSPPDPEPRPAVSAELVAHAPTLASAAASASVPAAGASVPAASASVPAASASVPAASASVPAVPSAPPSDVSACVAPLFAEGSFEEVPDLTFVCEIADPRRGADRMREAVVRGGLGRQISKGMREWAVMGWFELASFTVMRAHCCPGVEPVELPNSPGSCSSMADALNALGRAVADRADDATVDAAVEDYTKAVRCLNRAGATKLFGGHPQLAGGEEPAFRKTLARVRGEP